MDNHSKFHYMSFTAHLYSKLLLCIDLMLLKMNSLLKWYMIKRMWISLALYSTYKLQMHWMLRRSANTHHYLKLPFKTLREFHSPSEKSQDSESGFQSPSYPVQSSFISHLLCLPTLPQAFTLLLNYEVYGNWHYDLFINFPNKYI